MALRILVLEDDDANLRLFRAILERRGHSVLHAKSVEEGRLLLRNATFDLALLDVQVPGGGGPKLLAEMRADPKWAALPVAAVTASAMHGDREALLELGFDAYFSKPIDTRQFPIAVEAMVAAKVD